MEFRCDYCKVVFTDIEHYLKHKYITHDGQELRRIKTDDGLTWRSFLENFKARSRRELYERSARIRVNTNESVETTGEVINRSYGVVGNHETIIREQVLYEGSISGSVFGNFERHNRTQLSVQQVNPPVDRNQTCVTSRFRQMHFCIPQVRPETCEISCKVSDNTCPSNHSLSLHVEKIDSSRKSSSVNRSTQNLITNFENSNEFFRAPISTSSLSLVKIDAGSTSGYIDQYLNFKKDFAHKSIDHSCSEEFKTKKLKTKSSRKFCNDKITVILQDHDVRRATGYLPGETKSNKK
ncbi:hypothetical protein NPIL_505951 [Nephila pilipes]|uniref:C2H2-type domain-containing protein n=1 Tax=Nephila pilipes TaxID=299642 RepID=A0A8X6QR20_NEPPI|nr:hypothetical protein NPIL_505951 [Nephila pilipes]